MKSLSQVINSISGKGRTLLPAIAVLVFVTHTSSASAEDAFQDVLAPGTLTSIVCGETFPSTKGWGYKALPGRVAGQAYTQIFFNGRMIADKVVSYRVGNQTYIRRSRRGAPKRITQFVYSLDHGDGNLVSLIFRNDEASFGKGNFQRFSAYDLPSMPCEMDF